MRAASSSLVRVVGEHAKPDRLAQTGVLRDQDLQRSAQAVSNLTPNWYASIMGTGIVAVAAASLPWQPRGLHIGGLVVWMLAAVLLVALTAATGISWVRYPGSARRHLLNPVMAHFYGAPPMALLTVGAATLLLGRDVVGLRGAVDVDWILWFAGTVTGLGAAAVVPFVTFTGDAAMVPTLWIVLGPLGQSIAAANLLGAVAHQALPAPYSTALLAFGVVYGVPVWGFAVLWGAIAGAITMRTAREHLPFSLTWWSFTFPVGTCVLGTSELALHTGSDLFRVAAVLFYFGLVGAWITVALRTARGSLRGTLP